MRHSAVARFFVGFGSIFCLATSPAIASRPSAIEAPRPVALDFDKRIDRAFTILAKSGPEAFADEMAPFEHSGKFREQVVSLSDWWEEDASVNARAERIKKEAIGSSVARFHYLLCLPKKPVIWTVTFVKLPERGWLIRAFTMSGKLEDQRELFRGANAAGDFDDAKAIADEFATLLSSDTERALRVIVDHTNQSTPEDSKKMEDWITWMSSMRTALGVRGSQIEQVAIETVSPSLVRFSFVETAASNYGTWELFLYRPSDEWTVSSFRYAFGNDDTLDVLFSRSSAISQQAGANPAAAPRR